MKSTIDQLTTNEKAALQNFYGTPAYKALRTLIDAERLALAKDHVNQMDILQVRYLSGKATALKELVEALVKLNKEQKQKH